MSAVVAGFRIQIGQLALTPLMLLEATLEPIVYGILITAQVGSPTMQTLVGVTFVGLWASVIGAGAFAIVADKSLRTLEVALAAPTPIGRPLSGMIAAGLANGLIAVPAVWIVIALIWEPPAGNYAVAVAALLVGAAGFLGYGLLLAGLLARHRFFAGMLTGAYDVVAILACFFVPASFLPIPLNVVSAAFAPRWAIQAVDSAETHGHVALDLIVGAGVAMATIVLASLYLRHIDASIRRQPESMLV